jgi:hypothetical protein
MAKAMPFRKQISFDATSHLESQAEGGFLGGRIGFEENAVTSGAKAHIFVNSTARLKPCPYEATSF